MTLDLKPETAAALEALASAKGLSVEDYLEQLVEKSCRSSWKRPPVRSQWHGFGKRAIGLPYRQSAASARSR